MVLAASADRYRLIGAPGPLTLVDRQKTAQALVTLLGLTGPDAVDLVTKMVSDRGYVVLTRGIDEPMAARIRAALTDGSMAGLSLEPEPERQYPLNGGSPGSTLAAQLLGFVNRDGDGQYGVEQYYQAQLAGQPRVEVAQRDGGGDPVPDTIVVESPGVPGSDLRLTIDAGFQLQLEQELMAAGLADRALSVSGVVMDPYTGEIYGEATYPSYNGNDYAAIAATRPAAVHRPGRQLGLRARLGLQDVHRARGVRQRHRRPDKKINDSGSLALDNGSAKIYDSDKRPMGWIPFEDIVAYSRNVGAARVAIGLASSTKKASSILYGTWLSLGFGARTGIDVAGEVQGLVRDPTITPWRQVDLANGAFGQGVAVTPIQLGDGLQRDGQRRDPADSARRPVGRQPAVTSRRRGGS